MNRHRLVGVLLLCVTCSVRAMAQTEEPPAYQPLLDTLQQTIAAGDQTRFLTLLTPDADRDAAAAFARDTLPAVQRLSSDRI